MLGIIGLERESSSKPAGFRTHSLVCISAVLIMICGEYLSMKYNVDASRIPAQLLSGIGFIGAGTILRDGFNVKGLTTAASLLAVTCIGLSIGAGFYLGAILTTILVYFVLSYSHVISDRVDVSHLWCLRINSSSGKEILKQVEKILKLNKANIKEMKYNNEEEVLEITIKHRDDIDKNEIISEIMELEKVSQVSEN